MRFNLLRKNRPRFLANRTRRRSLRSKEGFPHVVAMGYRYQDGVIYMTSYGKAQKVVNVRRNVFTKPQVAACRDVATYYLDDFVSCVVRLIGFDPIEVRHFLVLGIQLRHLTTVDVM